MKKVLVLCMMAVLLCGVAGAEQTGSSWFHSHSYTDKDSYVDRYSEFEPERGNPLGIGLDLVVYEFEGTIQRWGLDTVEIQQKWDMSNNEYSGYIVGKANLWRLGKKLLRID